MEGEQNNVNTMGTESAGSVGSIIGIVVILTIIVLGGLYFWSQHDAVIVDDKSVESINLQSGTDDTASIEADLNNTNIENLDAELNTS